MEKIELERPEGKKGLMILRKHYNLLCIFILSMLELKGEITLTELLDTANQKLDSEFTGDALWMILNVKRDLEAKGLIRLKYAGKCTQVISVRKNQSRRISMFLREVREPEKLLAIL
ncbi:MAG TPA: hypothetical protein VIT44_07970 [Cyclobacteriaceae bacterium]